MPTKDLWTSSQRQAWGYVSSAYEQGMTQTTALKAYREAGGSIRTQYWGELWNRWSEGKDTWSRIIAFQPEDTIPESMYVQTDLNYRSPYNVTVKSNIRQEDGSILLDQYRTLRYDHKPTLGEILTDTEYMLHAYAGDYGIEHVRITDMQFFSVF